jgi:hypothetical protein
MESLERRIRKLTDELEITEFEHLCGRRAILQNPLDLSHPDCGKRTSLE